jgi:hypothetical protein
MRPSLPLNAIILLSVFAVGMPQRSFGQASAQRIERNLQVLYTLCEAGEDTITNRAEHAVSADESGTTDSLDLVISAPHKLHRSYGVVSLVSENSLSSAEPASALTSAISKANELSVEVWFEPANLQQTGPARIISLSADASHRNFTVGQEGDRLEVRLRGSATSENGLPSLTTDAGSLTSELTQAVFTKDGAGTLRIYLNGDLAVTRDDVGELSNWDSSYRLIVGDEATGGRAWLGALHLIAIYDRALSDKEVSQNFSAGTVAGKQLAERLPPAAARTVDFVADVQPILREHCFECHASGNEEGGLNLSRRSRVFEGGEHGAVLVVGNSLTSPLIHLVSGVDEERWMPPDDHDPLTTEQIGLLRAWIDQGANWPLDADVLDPKLEKSREHWAFQRLRSQTDQFEAGDPNESMEGRTDVPIDAIISQALQAQQLAPSEVAEARVLIRRLYFDLIGLPPSIEQAADFEARFRVDPQQAMHDQIGELLATRHYGERWGRHWLDLVRYADSDGQESDKDRPFAYRYRDFVIHALNDDMPFDQFVRWQIAGDEYEPVNPQATIATGFLVGGTHSELGDEFLEEERLFNRYNELDDVVSTLGTSLLGLTFGCARCHDHKYDAFSAREYYRMLSAFHSGDRTTGKLPSGEDGYFFRDFDTQVRTTWLFRRSDFYDRELEVKLGFPAILSAGRDVEDYWSDAKSVVATPKSTLQRRALAEWITDEVHGGGALLARVIVNRIWQHHFGYGIVRTESDFGVRGDAPTHPELLEALASDFVAHGWQLKRLHRQILSSRTWQQGSRMDSTGDTAQPLQALVQATEVDPENRWLWKMTPHRLEAEVLRDAMLSLSGTLNLEPYGPGFKPAIPAEANQARNLKDGYPKDAQDNAATRRRSVYMFHKRVVPYPLFQAFDRPDLLVSCSRRQDTTVAPQALALLNDEFVRSCAKGFAERLLEACGDDEQVVKLSFSMAFTRQPTESELRSAAAFIRAQSEARQSRRAQNSEAESNVRLQAISDYCQTLFALNEFIYVD